MELVNQTISPEDRMGLNEIVQVIHTEISRIPPFIRNVMLLCDIDNLSLYDAAARLNISLPAAKSRLARARKELRLRLMKHCGRRGVHTLMQKDSWKRIAYAKANAVPSPAAA